VPPPAAAVRTGARALALPAALDEVVRAFKFRGLDFLGGELARAAIEAGVLAELTDLDLVAPVPLPWPRRLVRGFNQAERLARPSRGRWGCRSSSPRPPRPGPRQAGLARAERAATPRGASGFGRTRGSPDGASCSSTTSSPRRHGGRGGRAAGAQGAAAVVVLVAAWTPPEPPPELP